MTKEEFARYLDGREYGIEFTSETAAKAKDSRLVIVYGDSFVSAGELMEPHECNCEFCGFKEKTRGTVKITSDYGKEGFTVTCSSPHAKFSVMEDGEKYGEGLVFQV